MIEEKSKKLSIIFIIICLLQIFYIFHYRSGFLKEVFINSFDENIANKYAVTKEVIEIKNLINQNSLTDFYLSEKLLKNTYFYQRSIEFNYPIRLNEESRNVFYLVQEDIKPNCNLVVGGKYLKLTKC